MPARIIVLFCILAHAVEGAAASCADAPLPAHPPVTLASKTDEPYEPLRGFDPQLRLGVGHLRPAREKDLDTWLDQIRIPLSQKRGGPITAWLSAGWLVPADGGTPRRVGNRGAVETGYETFSLIVLEASADWLLVRFAVEEASGTGWLNRCHLVKLQPGVVYERWDRLLGARTVSPLYFRSAGAHVLRRAPASGAPAIASIPAEQGTYALEPLAFRGAWMRARLKVPSDYCAGPEVKPVIRIGWVRWRDAQAGPLLWYHTRGC